MKRTLLLALAISIFLASSASAATTAPPIAIPLLPLSPTVSTNFTGGDEISQLLTSPTNILVFGTIETTTSQLVISPPLGGSDGFISALTPQGGRAWDLRLGTAGDDVATAGCLDTQGNIWVAGASTNPASSLSGLTRLTVCEVSSTGSLVNTFTKDLSDIDIPTSIAIKGGNFILQGVSAKSGFPTFAVTVSPLGAIGPVKNATAKPAPNAQNFYVASSAYGWQSFNSTKSVKGVLGLGSPQGINYLLKSSLKDKVLKAAYSVQGAPLAMQYQPNIGVVLLTQGSGSYFLNILHTK